MNSNGLLWCVCGAAIALYVATVVHLARNPPAFCARAGSVVLAGCRQ